MLLKLPIKHQAFPQARGTNCLTYWKSQHFKALQKLWYQRLQTAGFTDAEKVIGDELELKQTAYHHYRGADELTRQSKEAYYEVLSAHVHVAAFETDVDALILSWYADGKKIKAIYIELERLGKRRCRGTIRFTIRKYEVIWGIRKYTPKQLNKKTA